MSKSSIKKIKKGEWWNDLALAEDRYHVNQTAISHKACIYLAKRKCPTGQVKRRDGKAMLYNVNVMDKIFGYKDGVAQDDLFRQQGSTLKNRKEEKPTSETYAPTYEDFFHWCVRRRQYPKMFFEEYAEVENLRKRVNSDSVRSALDQALREIRQEQFREISWFFREIVGKRKDSPETSSYVSDYLDDQGNLHIDLFAGLRRRNGASSKTLSAPTGELPRKHGTTDKDALDFLSALNHTDDRDAGASLPRSQDGTEEGAAPEVKA